MSCKHLHKKTFYCTMPGTKVLRCQGIDCPYRQWVIEDPVVRARLNKDRLKKLARQRFEKEKNKLNKSVAA